MVNSKTLVKTISNSQMAWLINNKKVRFIESEGLYFSSKHVYVEITPDLKNPQGGWEVHN